MADQPTPGIPPQKTLAEKLQDEKNAQPKPKIQGLRTFSSDMAQAVRSGEASIVKIAIAEQKKKQAYENFSPTSAKNKFFIIGSISLLVLGALILVYFFVFANKTTVEKVPVEEKVGTLVFANENKTFDVTDLAKDKVQTIIKNEIKNATIEEGQAINLFFIESTTGGKKTVRGGDFIKKIGSTAPGIFTRALTGEYMMGIYKETENEPFIIFQNNNFNNTYAGLLEWESTMVDDFFIMFSIPVGGTESYILTKGFQDTTLKNIDVRQLLSNTGETVLIYGFLDEETMVLTTTESAFTELYDRYTDSKIER